MKKIFLGLVFPVVSMLGSGLFAAAPAPAPVVPVVTGVHVLGNSTIITYDNNERIECNNTTGVIRFFAANGVEVAPVPGAVEIAALRVIQSNNAPRVNRNFDVYNFAKKSGASVAAVISFLVASGISSSLFFKSIVDSMLNFDKTDLCGNCAKVAWQHGKYLKGVACSTLDKASDILPIVFPYVVGIIIAVIIFKRING